MNGFNTPNNNYYSLIKNILYLLLVNTFLFSDAVAQDPIDPNGYNKFYYANGFLSSEGWMRDGKPDGYWKTYYETGGLKSEGNRKDFQLDSIWTFYTEGGLLELTITYADDKKNGEEIFYSEAGNPIEEFTNVNNLRQGEGFFYYESGELYRQVTFVDNLEQGKGFEYAKDGRIITFLNYEKGYIRSIEKVNRLNKRGQRKGFWVEYWPNGNLKEEGNWTNDVRNGLFKFYKKNGELDKIEVYRGGEIVEDAEQAVVLDIRKEYYEDGKLKLIGSYKEGTKQGVFREYGKDGSIINSYLYENNTKTGEGIIDPEGKYQGNWKRFYPTGELRAEGQYIDGKKEGEWKFYYQNGKFEQRGNYKNDKPHGPWKWWYEDGSVWREEGYRKGREEGLMTEYDCEGNEINKGEYVDGYKFGPWFYTVNDHTEEGEYLDGEKNGLWVFTYDNGKTNFKGEFQAGVPIDKHEWYYRNGNLKEEGKYKGGEPHGTWKYFDESGLLYLSVKYRYGVKIKMGGAKLESADEEVLN